MKRVIMIFLLFSTILSAQEAIRVNEDYVLIDTDKDVGAVGEIVDMFRDVNGQQMLVGQVQIVKFVDGMTACKVHEGHVKVGDYVRSYEERLIEGLFPADKKTVQSSNLRKIRNRNRVEMGFLGGFLVPTGEMDEAFTTSLNLGGFIMISSSSYYNLFIELAYTFLSYKSEVKPSDTDIRASLFVINVYERFHVNPFFFFDFGGGIYFPRESVSASGISPMGTDTGFGVCVGPAFKLYKSNSLDVFLSCKYHTYNVEGEWLDFGKADIQFAF